MGAATALDGGGKLRLEGGGAEVLAATSDGASETASETAGAGAEGNGRGTS